VHFQVFIFEVLYRFAFGVFRVMPPLPQAALAQAFREAVIGDMPADSIQRRGIACKGRSKFLSLKPDLNDKIASATDSVRVIGKARDYGVVAITASAL